MGEQGGWVAFIYGVPVQPLVRYKDKRRSVILTSPAVNAGRVAVHFFVTVFAACWQLLVKRRYGL
jgi:hypothetical protein